MLTDGRPTLTQFLIEERRRAPSATGELNALITDLSLACKAISRRVAYGGLAASAGDSPQRQGETVEALSHETFRRANEWGGHVAGMLSGIADAPHHLPAHVPRGKYLLVFNALDGASNIDVNVTVGSIFSILRAQREDQDAEVGDYLQAGTEQVCAGYAVYGPSTMLVLTVGRGTHGFTLEPQLGEWVLSHPHLRIPTRAREFAINASHSRFWEPAVKRYVDECMAGRAGPRGADYTMRWVASLVAETHRILMRGGVFLYPRDTRESECNDRLRLLCDANPISFLVEQAGGVASTGRRRVMGLLPEQPHQRTGLIFGSTEEVELLERYHLETTASSYSSPLFGKRGLFSTPE